MLRVWLIVFVGLSSSLPLPAQPDDATQATIRWLRSMQTKDGGFRPAPEAEPVGSLRATSAAVRALRRFGGQPEDPQAAAHFVEKCWDEAAGSFADHPGGTGDVILTAVGLMAARELGLPLERYRDKALRYLAERAKEYEEVRMAAAGMEAAGEVPREPAARWLAALQARANPDGTFGQGAEKARATGGTIVAILRLGGEIKDQQRILELLNSQQQSDGGFAQSADGRSDLETTYRVMRCYHMLRAKPAREDALKRWVASCRHHEGGYGIRPGQPPTVGATYFAAMVLSWLNSP